MDAELESFRSRIDLRAYAAAREGYQLDRRESWQGSVVMRDARGDKIIVKRDADGHYVYFSIRRDDDNGSIIDFVQYRRTAPRLKLCPRNCVPGSFNRLFQSQAFPALFQNRERPNAGVPA
jgi:hypothetical protein